MVWPVTQVCAIFKHTHEHNEVESNKFTSNKVAKCRKNYSTGRIWPAGCSLVTPAVTSLILSYIWLTGSGCSDGRRIFNKFISLQSTYQQHVQLLRGHVGRQLGLLLPAPHQVSLSRLEAFQIMHDTFSILLENRKFVFYSQTWLFIYKMH